MNKLEKNDQKKISSKEMLTSMNQFKEMFMKDYLSSNTSNGTDENAIIVKKLDKSYLEVIFIL